MTDKEKMKYYERQIRKESKHSSREKWVTPAGGVVIKGGDGSILVGNEKEYDGIKIKYDHCDNELNTEEKRTE